MSSIFITGGASGIGLATAERFEREGWTVGVYDVNPEALDKVAANHPDFITGVLDVREPQQWADALAAFTEHTGGTLDVLDNNAGILVAGRLDEITPEAIRAQIDIDALGVTLGAQAAYPYLKKTPGAHLVNIASASAIYGQPGIATYSATKFYVAGLTEALELEWEHEDIRVVGIWPLWAKTALAENDAKSTKTLGVRITPEEVAEKVYESVNPNRIDRLLHRTSYSVGTQTLFLNNAAKFIPNFLNRTVNKLIAQ
ncbi:putative oxidoreductase, short-chain dehydrogenase/reductase family [Gordonia polyisoprenivorans VH2]|uniref:Putative oxidoreductase, short-chain dehydrogenase/reductase family n=1 Tax=Gordonia polyisoprenivorans (strain DSM 44266 / VH2) TaxID=1112204 RepID=H6N3C9_GORPV|nr:SDR family oxidoreductase [Gordonia polyisoprenivorans]AFA72288.1 putative oxidoreductase, short-chain dehydrogenase/reductase family [Gordonia polyisoprenivorans VH2]WCB38710.1 SDR family oxidoreductase [Gordonia polyisoprenivorans]